MCLIAFAYRHHPRFPLVVAANRDEFYRRPAAPAAFWTDCPQVLAGRDLLGRGTWLGVSRDGRFAALTNHRFGDGTRRDAPSRGRLVSEFLSGTGSPGVYLSEVAGRAHEYNGFCLLASDGEEMGYYAKGAAAPAALAPGIYGLSNAELDTPWPRVEHLKSRMAEVLSRPYWQSGDLMTLLGDRTPASDEALPGTGAGPAPEHRLSSAFMPGEHYGTRSSTVLSVDAGGRVSFTEQSFGPGGAAGPRAHFAFRIEPACLPVARARG